MSSNWWEMMELWRVDMGWKFFRINLILFGAKYDFNLLWSLILLDLKLVRFYFDFLMSMILNLNSFLFIAFLVIIDFFKKSIRLIQTQWLVVIFGLYKDMFRLSFFYLYMIYIYLKYHKIKSNYSLFVFKWPPCLEQITK